MIRPVTLVACIGFLALHPRDARPQQPSPAMQIRGRVVRSDTGVPLSGARIQLLPPIIAGAGNFQTAISGADGTYGFSGLRDGNYFVNATADGYVPATYQHGPSPEDQIVHVDSASQQDIVDLRLTPEASIQGSIVDSSHKPVEAGVSVAAVRKEVREDGSLRLAPVTSVETDRAGRFTLGRLPPGTYFVCVEGPGGWKLHPNPEARSGYKETWYGATPSIDGAIPLLLHEAQQIAGLQIAVTQEPRFHIIVRPSGPSGDILVDHYDVVLQGRNHTSSQGNDGSYLIPDIPPGRYTLRSTAWSGVTYVGQGEAEFNVVDADVTVDLAVGGLGSIAGTVTEPGCAGPIGIHPTIGITSAGAAQGSAVAADHSFRFDRVLPGRYTFRLWNAPSDLKIESARCGAGEIGLSTPLLVGAAQTVTECRISLAWH